MPRCILFRLALPALAVAGVLANTAIAQSQDSLSVAEAARRARAQKKNTEKPARVITDETLDVKKGDVQSAAAEQLKMPGSPDKQTQAADASGNTAPATAQSRDKAKEDEKAKKERDALKEQIKQAQSDLDLLRRDQSLKQDTYYSNPDYTHDTAGKSMLDTIKQQIADKQQELDQLRTKLAELGATLDNSAAPPKP
jgi:hypothetical protein